MAMLSLRFAFAGFGPYAPETNCMFRHGTQKNIALDRRTNATADLELKHWPFFL